MSYGPCKSPWNPKLWAIVDENGHKTGKRQFFVITLKHVSYLTGHANPHETLKQWGIAHVNGHKTRKRRVLVISLKHVSCLMGHANRLDIPKTVANSS